MQVSGEVGLLEIRLSRTNLHKLDVRRLSINERTELS